MAGISLSGLIDGSFDWKSVVDQLMKIEATPIARLQTEESKNVDKIASLTGLRTGLEGLQTAVNALRADGLFNGRLAASTSSGSGWSAAAANDTVAGSYTIAVSQLAMAARRVGASSIATSLNAAATDLGTNPNGIAGLTLATLPTATPITAGDSFFTINGHQITINSADSLQSVFDEISSATDGEVTASYDAATDKVTLTSSSEIVLGAGNDTSNFLQVLRLANNSTGSISSSSSVGAVALYSPLSSGRLAGSLAGVDTEGNGSFLVNGVSIGFNVNTDSLGTVLSRISDSSAGVNATYDRAADRVILTNKATGDTGMSVSDVTGGLASALGLTAGYTTVRGTNAQFRVNNGEVLSSTSNSLTADALGVEGLSIVINSETTQTVEVKGNTAAMKSAIDDFITKFNDVQKYIDEETAITKTADGSVSAAILAGNREVEGWGSQLRTLAFAKISGLSGTLSRLEDLGIDFESGESTLSIKDSAKLDAALSGRSEEVAEFFSTANTGFVALLDTFLDRTLNEQTGALSTQVDSLNGQNSDLEEQMEIMNRRLEQQRQLLTDAFLAMQEAQSKAQQQQQTLTNMLESWNSDS